MCGRFTLISDLQVLEKIFGVVGGYSLDWAPRHNIAPTQPVLIVRPRAGGGREFALARWGLRPQWADDPASAARMINARAETAHEKPAFRGPFRRRRCVVPADGWFEWRAGADGKRPHWFHARDGRPLALAGLWERREDPGSGPLETCAILTTAANALAAPIHDRMPVVLDDVGVAAWLDPALEAPETLRPLLHPAPEGLLAVHEVGRAVGSPKNEGPSLIRPVA